MSRIYLSRLALAGTLALTAPMSRAADSLRPLPSAGVANTAFSTSAQRHVDLVVGKSVILDLPRDATEIFVANPDIANAVVRSARRLYIIGATVGQTTIVALDANGQKIASVDLSVGRDMDQLRLLLQTAIPDNEIKVSTVGDTVVLTGTVADLLEAQKAADIAQAFVGYSVVGGGGSSSSSGSGTNISIGGSQVVSGKLINALSIRGKDQVTLRVTIAEVQRKVLRQLGINATATSGNSSFSVFQPPLGGRDTDAATGLAKLALTSGVRSLTASLEAMEKNGFAHVLAEPTVTAISGESAKFNAGGTVPVFESATISGSACQITVKQQPYGVSLNFIPTVPGLMDLPILGSLFRSRDYQRSETELMIIVTPFIARPLRPDQVARPDDGFVDASDAQSVFLGRVNKAYSTSSDPRSAPNYRGRVGFIHD